MLHVDFHFVKTVFGMTHISKLPKDCERNVEKLLMFLAVSAWCADKIFHLVCPLCSAFIPLPAQRSTSFFLPFLEQLFVVQCIYTILGKTSYPSGNIC